MDVSLFGVGMALATGATASTRPRRDPPNPAWGLGSTGTGDSMSGWPGPLVATDRRTPSALNRRRRAWRPIDAG